MTSGGRRAGAGRKAIPTEQKRVQISVTVDYETRTKINKLRRAACPIGRRLSLVVYDEVERLARDFEISD